MNPLHHLCVLLAVALCAALAGCGSLTADAPLFTVADQAGPPPLQEGVWIAIGEKCPPRYLRRESAFPRECSPLELTRAPSGAWSAHFRADLVSGLSGPERDEAEAVAPMQALLVPAVERQLGQDYAPAYIAEIAPHAENARTSYAVLVPLGTMPVSSMLMLTAIDCHAALRDGPIAGVAEHYREHVDENGVTQRDLSGCVASTQGAVREAARRALIEDMANMLEHRFMRLGAEFAASAE